MDPLAAGLNYEPSQSEDELARAVITMWTNFAKTGLVIRDRDCFVSVRLIQQLFIHKDLCYTVSPIR